MRYLIFICLLLSWSASANIAVIVHPSNTSEISRGDLNRIFSGKLGTFSNGNAIVPINQIEGSPALMRFNDLVLKKNSAQIKAYWSKLVFTGKGTPPQELKNDEEVLAFVASNPNAIGYINPDKVNDSVKVIETF